MWMIAINLLKAYWKPVVALIAITAWSWYWYDAGREAVKSEWEAERVAQVMAIQAEKDLLIDEFNKKSSEFEVRLANEQIKNKKLNARVNNEIRKNTTYSNCIVTTDGVQLYNDSITTSGSPR